MGMRFQKLLIGLLVCVALAGCEHFGKAPASAATAPAAAPTLAGDPAHPPHTSGWVDTKLYFGLGPADDSSKGVSEARWRAFLDSEVTPRFPDGLSVLDVYGQWQGKGKTAPERIRTKLLVIDYPDTAENRARIEAIRAAWKQLTGDDSVMRVTEPADVSF
jgi:Protein of unknown function (DUF3574)